MDEEIPEKEKEKEKIGVIVKDLCLEGPRESSLLKKETELALTMHIIFCCGRKIRMLSLGDCRGLPMPI